ncbi:hypothetical protein [Streptomyces fulvorobeus]|uniref:Uncharacterized protein n=1 Tax=Streptomyces fulvorobeus TaxID=284028 RepID=A0A7Y9HB93_9ACTN|nr:hypothetical protein [Streptomyces fulvorobeus]NYE40719.1 hypothetical protein [Streptomyces fulvorobeus]
MIRALTAHAPAFALCAVCFVLAALLDQWDTARHQRAARRRRQR